MRQHNYWKMKHILNYLLKFTLYGTSGVILISIIVSEVILKEKFEYNIIPGLVSIILIIVGFLWNKFEKKWWKNDIWQKLLPDDFNTPDIAGRWEGYFIRDEEKHDFVLEIKQTFTSVSCITYSKHSQSNSILAEILYNSNLKTYQLVYYWEGKTSNTKAKNVSSLTFRGFTVLNINVTSGNLKGNYFTDREPLRTRGTLVFNVCKEELKGAF